MGTWGVGAYENDTALDWASDTGAGLASIETALDEVLQLDGGDYLDAEAGAIGVAACEALHGYHLPTPGLLDKLGAIFGRQPKGPRRQVGLIAKADKVLVRVTDGNSELAELWAEAEDDGASWREAIDDLRRRLDAIPM